MLTGVLPPRLCFPRRNAAMDARAPQSTQCLSRAVRFGETAKPSVKGPDELPSLERLASIALQELLTTLHPTPVEKTWPIALMKSLCHNTDVVAYLNEQGLSWYDIYDGLQNRTLSRFRMDAKQPVSGTVLKDIVDSARQFGLQQQEKKVNGVTLWRWLMLNDPTGNVEDFLSAAGLNEDMIARLRKALPSGNRPQAVLGPPGKADLIKLNDAMKTVIESVVGQEEAVTKLAQGFRRAKVRYTTNPRKKQQPKNRALLLGPSGVGKTMSAEMIAELTGRPVIYEPMNQYNDGQAKSMITGAAPGYTGYGDGGSLASKLIKANEDTALNGTPPPIVILDEIEKADKSIFDTLMQALDKGRLKDGTGKEASLEGVDVIMTSNIAQEQIAQAKHEGKSQEEIQALVKQEMRKHFRLEFINRINNVVIYETMAREDAGVILEREVEKLRQAMAVEDGIVLNEVPTAVLEHVLDEGFSEEGGARGVLDYFEATIHDAVAMKREALILGDALGPGRMTLSLQQGRIQASFRPQKKPPTAGGNET